MEASTSRPRGARPPAYGASAASTALLLVLHSRGQLLHCIALTEQGQTPSLHSADIQPPLPCHSRVMHLLGGRFDYSTARAELEQARRAAKQLLHRRASQACGGRQHGHSGVQGAENSR